MNRSIALITVLIFLASSTPVYGQFYSTQYRVPGQDWVQVQTERFRLVFPARYDDLAYRALAILESDYDDIQQLVGGEIRNFPFILNPDNDRSNGFVAPLNFRSEVEISPIIGKTMNPRSGSWMELVLPHELVHVMHFNVNPRSLTSLMGLFSPDVRRSIHSAAPLGVFEGIAVYHESHGSIPYSGRGHHPYFRNQFNAMVDSRHEWSMGQLLQVTDFTPPFDRHYIGGYEFTHWLLHQYGDEAMKEAIEFHFKYPFLGFGTALRRVTGKWPGMLYREFSNQKNEAEQERTGQLEHPTAAFSEEIPFRAQCRRMNRPKWLDEDTIIFYARSCNRPAGFYLHQLQSGQTDFLYERSIPTDFIYSLSDDRSYLIYTRYHTDMLYDNLFRGDLHRLDLSSGSSERITNNKRLFSPELRNHQLFATQTAGDEMQLVRVDPESGEILQTYSMPEQTSAVQAAINPHRPGNDVVIGRIKSVQGIWFVNLDETNELFTETPHIVFDDGSIYDIAWHPAKERFLFVSDVTGTMNVYEYDVRSESVTQKTESLHNAFEASYSPDGSTIAYIAQVYNEQKLFVMDADKSLNRTIDRELWNASGLTRERLERPLMNRETDPDLFDWNPEPYRTGAGWLKPRFWSPKIERVSGLDQIGVNLESVDLMSRQAYSADVYHYADRFWYNLTYRNQRFYPGFVAELFNQPILTTLAIDSNNDDQQPENNEETESDRIPVFQHSRGGSLKVPVRFRFESNTRFTSLLIEPQYFISQIRFLDGEDSSVALSDFGTRHTIGLRSVFNYRVRQFNRDVQPNRGLVLFAEGRTGLNSDAINISSNEFTVTGNLARRQGLRAGAITYISPLSRWNQSMRVSAEVYSQTDVPVFNLFSQFSDLFSEIPLTGVNNAGILNTRYTIPLTYPDDGGLLVPVYLSNIYLVLFSQTVTDLNSSSILEASRTVYGAGIRSRFRLSNLAIDIGISVGWEPARNEFTWFFGSF